MLSHPKTGNGIHSHRRIRDGLEEDRSAMSILQAFIMCCIFAARYLRACVSARACVGDMKYAHECGGHSSGITYPVFILTFISFLYLICVYGDGKHEC